MKYYTQNQLDKYIQKYGKLDINIYFLINEAAKYLDTTNNKILLLKQTRELYPLVINDEEYYIKEQLDLIKQNNIFDKYHNSSQACAYLNIFIETL